MAPRQDIGRVALRTALRIRTAAGIKLWEALSVFDLAEQLGIDVWFVENGSLEGMYWRHTPPTIFLSAQRPCGRQAFTCGHELGHHIFGHGTRMDELLGDGPSRNAQAPEESLADLFSGFLLMPQVAVNRGFQERGWDPGGSLPEQVYTVAHWLGVGYTTLVNHMCFALRILPRARGEALLKAAPKSIRLTIAGDEVSHDLIVVDEKWSGRAVDAQVGDLILLPQTIEVESKSLRIEREDATGKLVRAIVPGRGRFFSQNTEWAVYVRVSRREYVGRNMFRHLEEVDDE